MLSTEDKEKFKLKLSKSLFSLYPFFNNFNSYTSDVIYYDSEVGVKIGNKQFSNLDKLTDIIINLISAGEVQFVDDEAIVAIIKENNEIYRFHMFLKNFISIISFDYSNISDRFADIYKIYDAYIINNSNVDNFIRKYKKEKSSSSIGTIMKELYSFKVNADFFNESIQEIINQKIENEEVLSASLYDNEYDILYSFNDFIDYLQVLYKELLKKLEDFMITFASQITLYNSAQNPSKFEITMPINNYIASYMRKELEGLSVSKLREKQDIKTNYKEAIFLLKTLVDKSKDRGDEERYEKVKEFDKKKKDNLKLSFAKLVHLLDSNKGKWREDIENAGDFKDELDDLQYDFNNILQLLDYTKVEIKSEYYELDTIYKKLQEISRLVKAKKRIPKEDYDLLTNFSNKIEDFKTSSKYEEDSKFKDELLKVVNLYKTLSEGDNAVLSSETIEKTEIIRKDTIYFDTNIAVFKIILKYMIMFGVVLVLIILLLSLISVFTLFYDIIMYFITLFINPTLTKAFTIDYLTKNMVYCNKNNEKDDRYYLFSIQRQNLNTFTLTAYIFYLLLILFVFYMMHVLYSTVSRKFLKGSIYDIDKEGAIIIIFIIILMYSIIHLLLYKFIFKPLIYTPYNTYKDNEMNVDKILDEYILILNNSDSNNEITVDENFFNILFDSTRIDDLNTLFLNGIKENNASGCLEQKIIMYDLYIYLKEHISFDKPNQERFKQYCINKYDNKPLIQGTDKRTTFISLLNSSEVKMIKKFHENLEFVNNIPDDKNEYYNNLNKSLTEKIKRINENIITYNKTLLPFFVTILYIIGIFLFTAGLFYMLINYVLMGDAKMSDDNKFNYYFVYSLYMIKTNIYDKFINWIYR